MKIVARSVKHTHTHYDGKLLTNVAIEGHPSIISNVIGSNSIYTSHDGDGGGGGSDSSATWISVTKRFHAVAKYFFFFIFEMWLEIEYNDNLLHFIPHFVEIAAAAAAAIVGVVVVFRLSLDILRSVLFDRLL